MWSIFPQFAGLGRKRYRTILRDCLAERSGRLFLIIRSWARDTSNAWRRCRYLATSDVRPVFGGIDAMKLRSSLTLFEAARPLPLFAAALDRWFGGERDTATLRLLGSA